MDTATAWGMLDADRVYPGLRRCDRTDLRIPYTLGMTVAREASLTNRTPVDAETLEMIYRAEEDPLRKAQIRKQLEEMRKQVETRMPPLPDDDVEIPDRLR
jgi:hypothetical protein